MIVLGVDTAGGACSVALRCDGVTQSARQRTMPRGHAEALVPLILEVLAEAGLDPGRIDLYGVTIGPGAFTGLRVGLATVAGMALAQDRPIVGIGSFEAAAADALRRFPDARRVLVLLESRRAELFAGLFDAAAEAAGAPRAAGAPFAVAPDALAAMLPPGPLVLAGDAAERGAAALADAGQEPAGMAGGPADAALVAALAEARAGEAGRDPPSPYYMRAPDARPSRPGRRSGAILSDASR
ncbi:MAG: tRNA (adenosine(37)-N6)-threonylcarbamoyltransferase complex dimerization subunit type 1 TsaB [Alphaproteobacteria bacterium]|jgi:tRNA threonylcarbamoyladenosine biosynthesis protein TsaB|nr:tRNA (adenosine(37)-N6)-threonylcarbamoyltransferase complex dimerization subunit type 1 TsaB [Alphaproteobacteria bacterium]